MSLTNKMPANGVSKDFPYFRRMWNTVVIALLAASFIPLMLLGGGMYYYASFMLEAKTLDSLSLEAVSHKDRIDRFLAERVMSLKVLAKNIDTEELNKPGKLERVFKSLQTESEYLLDLGVINENGKHLAYAGPYDLMGKNYKDAPWFHAVMANGEHISDLFLGFRNAPHFIIAVRQEASAGAWILRATIDSDYFNTMVAAFDPKKEGTAYLVNTRGVYQTSHGPDNKLMGQFGLGIPERFDGVRIRKEKKDVKAMVWLENVPWLCVAQMDSEQIFKELSRLSNMAVCLFILGGILIVLTVFLTTDYLVSRLEHKRQSIRVLDRQLRHAGGAASSMRMSSGLFAQIKDILANIDTASKWLCELARKKPFDQEVVKEVGDCAKQIQDESNRGWQALEKFRFTRRAAVPVISDVDIHQVLDDIKGFLEYELRFESITLTRDYHKNLPMVRSDPDLLWQALSDLLLTVVSVAEKGGSVTIATHLALDSVEVVANIKKLSISSQAVKNLLSPPDLTTNGQDGPGLFFCASALSRIRGDIRVTTQSATQASFKVSLPLKFDVS